MAVTVLIVDDHAGFRSQARELLESQGYHVVGEAADGQAALAAIAALEPDVVLLDVQLPDGNGFEIAARLEQRTLHSRIVMVSARDATTNRRRLSQFPGLPFISKPDLSGAALEEMFRSEPD